MWSDLFLKKSETEGYSYGLTKLYKVSTILHHVEKFTRVKR